MPAYAGLTPWATTKLQPRIRDPNTQSSIPPRNCCVLALGIQFYVPVQVISPALRSVLENQSQAETRYPARLNRFLNELHAGFSRSETALSSIAIDAGCDDVFPTLRAAARHRNHVV